MSSSPNEPTRSKPPTDISGAGKADDPIGDPWPEEEVTRVDAFPPGEVTPVVSPVCPECGGVVLTDDFDVASLAGFPSDRCVRGVFGRWHSCFRLKKAVFYW